MSNAPEVDFTQIRGDWHFHLNFLANAVEQTLARSRSMWAAVADEIGDPAIGELLGQIDKTWSALKKTGDKTDAIDTADPGLQEFIELSAATKPPCDSLEEARKLGGSASIYDTPIEQFTESLRQLRSFGDDLQMMREQKP